MSTSGTIKKSALAPTILIAGGAGFIGSHLAEVLLQKEARVIILDNFRTGKEIHVNHLLSNPKFALYDVDINEGIPQDIESVDYIFHLASLEEYLYSKDSIDLDSLLTNALGTKNLLDLASRSNAKFLLASTIDVYEGKMSQLSLDNYFGKTSVDEKKYSLAEAKRYAEALVWEYHKRNNTNVRIVRIPEVYGPRMSLDASGVLGKIMRDLMEGRPFLVKGDGSKKDFYLYINDAVSGMIKALLNDSTSGNIYTLVPSDSISMIEVAYLVRSLADRPVEIKFEDTKSLDDPREFKPDTYNLIYLRWSPKVSLKDGIVTTLNWFGYSVNQHAFKSAKLIDQDKKRKAESLLAAPAPFQNFQAQQEQATDALTTVQSDYNERKISNLKEIPKVKKRRATNIKLTAPKMPKLKKLNFALPKLNFNLPEVSFASQISMFFVVLFSFIAVFVLLPGYKTYSAAKNAMSELEAVPELISKFETDAAAKKATVAFTEFSSASKFYSSLDWVYKLLGRYDEYKAISKFLNSVTYFSSVAADTSLAVEPLAEVWDTLKPESTKSFDPETLSASKLHITDAQNNLQLAIADFNEVDLSFLPESIQDNTELYAEVLGVATEGLDFASSMIVDLPSLLGFDEPKKYLVLFQNNNEIRPTGGFIGSYAFLYLNKGKIEELNIDDIYNPDGQLDVRNIRVLPPKPIGDLLVEDRLYIRNANWDPDFPRSAETIKDLFFRINGEDIDGVLSLDLNVAAEFLNITGPLFLTAYNEEISADNLYARTQFHSSYNYEEGSQQKRQFLTILGSKLLESLFALETEKTQDLAVAVGKLLRERHLQIHLFSNSLNAALMEKGWTGNLTRTDGDYLQVVNANLGGTKANFYVEDEMSYNISSKTRDGLLRGELTLNYVHNGVDESWPGGPYTNYLRVLTQKGSKLTGAKIIYDLSIEQDIFEEMIISSVDPYTSFETSFVLQPSSSAKVILFYDLAPELSITKSSSDYSLVWQKQAGTHNDKFSYSLDIPFGMSYIGGTENLNASDDTVFTGGVLNEDLELFVALE